MTSEDDGEMAQTPRNEKILNIIRAKTNSAMASKKEAKRVLVSEKIYTSKGKLRKEFGGNRARNVTDAA